MAYIVLWLTPDDKGDLRLFEAAPTPYDTYEGAAEATEKRHPELQRAIIPWPELPQPPHKS